MPIPIDLLRGLIGVLCVFFAHFLGRSAARRSGVFGWSVRTVLTGLAVGYRYGLDGIMLAVLIGAGVSAALGFWLASRPSKPDEDLTGQIFPPE